MEQAFSKEDPQPGSPRLWCPGDHDDRTVKGQQEGAHRFAAGCFLAIRNPAAHGKGDWNPVTAFEWLAALSIVARWGRHWKVVR
jgi:hypothetical protein